MKQFLIKFLWAFFLAVFWSDDCTH